MNIDATTCPDCNLVMTYYDGYHCPNGCDYLDEQMQKAIPAWDGIYADKFVEELRNGELELHE